MEKIPFLLDPRLVSLFEPHGTSGKPTMRATFLCLCFLYMNRITKRNSCLITLNSGNPSDIESTYETSLMFISPLTLLLGSRQCFLFFVTKSQIFTSIFLNESPSITISPKAVLSPSAPTTSTAAHVSRQFLISRLCQPDTAISDRETSPLAQSVGSLHPEQVPCRQPD